MKAINVVTLLLVIVGGLNWGLVGLLGFDVVAALFGSGSLLSRIVYILVGLSASTAQARLARVMWPVTRRLMMAGMNARPALIGRSRRYSVPSSIGSIAALMISAIWSATDWAAPTSRLRACLGRSRGRPPVPLYGRIVLPARVEETLARWRRRPSLAWTQRLYADYRRERSLTSPHWV